MLFLLGFLLAEPARAAAEPFTAVIARPRGEAATLDPKQASDLPRVLDLVSAALVGRPYELGPLGEGEGSDHPKPLYRTDAFDCTTFLETVLTNAYCFRAGEKMAPCLKEGMRRIRYSGNGVSFAARNHVPELDWLPENVARGYVEDLSGSLFPGAWREATPTIDRDEWLATQGAKPAGKREAVPLRYLPVSYFFRKAELSAEALKALDDKLAEAGKTIAAKREAAGATGLSPELRDELQKEQFRADLAYVRGTWTAIPERLKEIPSGTVLNLVRAPEKDRARAKLTPLVSHQGLVIQKPEGPRIRHAAANVGHVTDQSLADYLLRFVRSSHYRGVALYQVKPISRKGP